MRLHIRSLVRIFSTLSICLGIALATDAPPTFAAAGGCRSDPKVWLSNGTKITMTASITADASTVKTITYTVHIPRGVRMTSVVYTGGVLKDKERVVVVADRTKGYLLVAFTDMGTARASVTIDAAVGNDKRTLTGSNVNPIMFLFP